MVGVGEEGVERMRQVEGLCRLHLAFGEVQVHRDFVSPQPGQVVVMCKLRLQLPQLLLGEGRPLLASLAAAIRLPAVLLVVWGREDTKQEDMSLGGPWSPKLCPEPAALPVSHL